MGPGVVPIYTIGQVRGCTLITCLIYEGFFFSYLYFMLNNMHVSDGKNLEQV